MVYNLDQLKAFPKADLHVHLDGSLRLNTLIELSQTQNLKLPSYTEEGLRELVFKNSYNNLPEYLEGFGYTCAIMQDPESLERISYEFAWDCFHDGVVYVEPRYSPELFRSKNLSVESIIQAIDSGLARASREINSVIQKTNSQFKEEKINAQFPHFTYSHIVCAMRMWAPERSLSTTMAAVAARDKHGLPVMAIDLAGPESGFPAMDHQDAYIYAHKNFMYKTVHAGEAYGPPSIFQALTYLYADRIGHGFHLFSTHLTNQDSYEKSCKYIENLVQYIAERRITIETCLTSNLQTLPELNSNPENHSLIKMLNAGISVAICTDNMLVSNTTVSKELKLAIDTFKLDAKKIKKLTMYGIKRGFYPGNYLEKKSYIDLCSKYYDYLAGLNNGN